MELEQILNNIQLPDENVLNEAKKRWDSVAKPLHSLGLLEDIIVKIAAIQKKSDISIDKRAVVIMCADNGVVNSGVTQTGKEVTAIVSRNFTQNNASVCIMSEIAKADVIAVDIGIDGDMSDCGILERKIANGTKNIEYGAAMTYEELIRAINTGIELVGKLKNKGYTILATGEMGIGNTTTSSAVTSVLLNTEVQKVTGRGAGLCDEALKRKIEVINRAIKINKPNKDKPLEVLQKLGGFDIAGLTGVFIGGAAYNVPIVIDGFISAAAALAAYKICDKTKYYMIASHVSKEPAMKFILDEIKLEAAIHANMSLGEGTGAVALFPLLDMAYAVYKKMSTFKDINIEEYKQL